VLCVDLDGTFFRTDTLHESLLKVFKTKPTALLRLPFWLARGKCFLKRALSRSISKDWDMSTLPRQPEVESLVAKAKSMGRTVELISATDHDLICDRRVFREMFNVVIGSSEGLNLKGETKAKFLSDRHPDGFAYVGNSAADLPVWRVATECFAVNISHSVRRRAAREGIALVELARRKPPLSALLKAMRLHQWLKNILVLVPLMLMAPRAGTAEILTALAGFLLFGLLTSGTYIINDILDVESDRQHPRKMQRPVASGDLPFPFAAIAATLLIGAAMLCALFLSPLFALVLLVYLAITLSYSFLLKSIPLIDVLTIATLFTLRIVVGMVLLGQPLSHWLLIFSIFFFFSLVLMKREVELGTIDQAGDKTLHGRGYVMDDRTLLLCFGVSSGVASIVVFSLFVSSTIEEPASPYVSPQLLWGAMGALSYWIMRMWLLTARGVMYDDPILFAARDRVSLILASLIAVFFLAAQLVRIQ